MKNNTILIAFKITLIIECISLNNRYNANSFFNRIIYFSNTSVIKMKTLAVTLLN